MNENKQIIDKTMPFSAANIWGTAVAILIFVIFFGINRLIWGTSMLAFVGSIEVTPLIFLFSLIALVISISVHELLHGVGYNLGGADWSEIKFGLHQLTPYAHCKKALDVDDYRLAVALPGLLLGIAPAVGGLFSGSLPILLYGAFMTSAAAGDALILWLLRDAPEAAQVLDHPSKVGCELHI